MVTNLQRVAHRGGAHLAPENTLAAFHNALTLPIDAIELDIQMSRDGRAIVFHDDMVERLTNGEGNILDLDFATLRSLDAAVHFPGSWPKVQQIPTLREVLDLSKGRTQVYIEIKPSKRDGVYGRYPNIAETVVNEVRDAGLLNQALIISFDWLILPLIKSLAPTLQTGAIVSADVWASHAEDAMITLIEQMSALGVDWINMDAKLFMTDMPTIAHKHGFKLGIWTVDTLDELRYLAMAGVDSLTTNRPDLFAIM